MPSTLSPVAAARFRRFLLIPAIALTALAGLAPAQQPTTAEPTAVSVGDLGRQAWELAGDGKLDAVWSQIKQLPADGGPAVSELREELAVYEQLEAERSAKTAKAFEEKVAEMDQNLADAKLRKALGNAVEASGLAPDPDVFLAELKIKELVAEAESRAANHEKAGEWPQAFGLYRALDLLYEHQNKYTEPLKRVGRRVMLLRLYAPDVLFELYKQEAKELGEDEPEPFNTEDDHWQKQLEGVSSRMLHESLHLGSQQHVEGSSYAQLLLGGIDGLKTLLTTKGLEKTFPTLAEEAKVNNLTAFLDQVTAQVNARALNVGYLETAQWLKQIQDRNFETVNLPEAVITHELGDGSMTTLDDFSNIIWPHDKARFDRTISGKFSGVGIQISLVNRQLTVVTPLSDTPAHRAGIKPGERIVTIDGKSTLGMELDTAVDLITGDEGTKVTLGIKGASDDAAVRDVELTRKTIKIYSVKGWDRKPGGEWDYYIDPGSRIGYVRMTSFGPTTADELDEAVQSMTQGDGLNGLILDLRFNPGGLLKAAEEVSNRFLDGGVIVSTTQTDAAGNEWSVSADASHTYRDFPVVVLINKGSASASEIVSGALQDHDRAIVVGERSFGKGSVQNLFRIGGGSAFLKLTTQYYKIPSGRIIHRRPGAENWGITPDITVRMTDRQVADSIEARTLLDILREDGDGDVNPEQVLNSRAKDDEDDGDKPKREKIDVKTPGEILTKGIDPQLETALLLLKTRLLPVMAEAK